ncbi:regulatory CII family protein [Rahnella aceris]|uniref:Regulatory CII family protein n=1 Tax=Rahnella sp. (strain Y9602) TaxID=2703885 RepID=A0A0H3FAK6_RAHSY|nr:phage regulatory CII family protein [Rahnella aceris]ADW74156.1 regulatory CII family protein [Rahnella aceris]MBU9839368.1 phage regulatory CII family protein [Rahnella aceris]
MFDYQTSIHPHFDTACRRFSLAHNLTKVAAVMGISAQVLRNKLNPDQPHRLTVNELIMLTDITDDSAVLDGLLAQLKCLPAVPVNEAKPNNLPMHALSATAAIGVIAGEAISPAPMTQSRRNAILDRANQAIRDLSLLVVSVESRFHTTPVLASAMDVISSCGVMPGLN